MQHQYMFLVVSDSSLGPAFPNYCCYSTTPTDNVDSPLDLLRIKQGLPFQLVDVKVIIGKNIRKFEKLQLSNHPLSCLSHRKFFFVYFSANSMFWGCSLHFLCVLCSLYLIFVTFKLKQFFHRIIWLGSNFNVSRILLFDFSLFAQSVQWEQSVIRGQSRRMCALAIIHRFVTFTVAFIVIFMAWQFNVVGQSPNWLFSLWTIAQATVVAHGVKPWQVLSNKSHRPK